jgi:hypothetical protein
MKAPRTQKLVSGGVYPAKVTRVDEGASEKGNPMMTLFVSVGEPKNEVEIRDYLTFTAYGKRKIIEFARAVGLPAPDDEEEEVELEADECLGRRALVEVKAREKTDKDGVPYLGVTKWLPSPPAQEASDSDVIAF